MHGSDVCAEAGGVCVFGNGDEDLNVVGSATAFELGFGLFLLAIVHLCLERGCGGGTLSMYSILDPECDSTKHSTQINGLTCVFSR